MQHTWKYALYFKRKIFFQLQATFSPLPAFTYTGAAMKTCMSDGSNQNNTWHLPTKYNYQPSVQQATRLPSDCCTTSMPGR